MTAVCLTLIIRDETKETNRLIKEDLQEIKNNVGAKSVKVARSSDETTFTNPKLKKRFCFFKPSLSKEEKYLILIIHKLNQLYSYLRIHVREDFTEDFKNLNYFWKGRKVEYKFFINLVTKKSQDLINSYKTNFNKDKISFESLEKIFKKGYIGMIPKVVEI